MAAITGNTDPRLKAYDYASPAMSLSLDVGCDAEGWPLPVLYAVGQIVTDSRGNTWRIIGFLRDNQVVVAPYGLNVQPGVVSAAYHHEGLRHIEVPITGSEVWPY